MENQVTDDIYWIGVHMPVGPGGSMNSYLILDEHPAVIDTTAPATAPRVLENLRALVDPSRIEYIVLTHADLDHAGGLAALLEAAPNATVVGSEGETMALGMWGLQPKVQVSEDDSQLSLGRHTLRFVSTPHVCTPAHQVVFDERDGVLFSGDLFAQMGPPEWSLFAEGDRAEGLRFAQDHKCGVTQYPGQAIDKLRSLPIEIVASGHGQLIRDDIARYMDALSA